MRNGPWNDGSCQMSAGPIAQLVGKGSDKVTLVLAKQTIGSRLRACIVALLAEQGRDRGGGLWEQVEPLWELARK